MKRWVFLILLLLVGLQPVLATGGGGKTSSPRVPRYYTFDDLYQCADNYRGDFSFYNDYKPANAIASLPSQAPDGGSNYLVNLKIRAKKVKGKSVYLDFPWDDPRVKVGDIIYIRGGDTVSKIIRKFSTWTHTAMVYNKTYRQSFESQNSNGVNTYYYKAAWPKIVSYAARRVETSNIYSAMDRMLKLFRSTPYFPKVDSIEGLSTFFST